MRRHHEYGGSLRRVRCQANGLAYASTLELPGMAGVRSMRSMNLPTSVAESVKAGQCYLFSGQVSATPAVREGPGVAQEVSP